MNADCIEYMQNMPAQCVDLAFADPPFNIRYAYNKYRDDLTPQEYYDWCKSWGYQMRRVLKPFGTFWLAIGDKYAAELKCLFTQEIGFTCRSWVIWHYTFGVNVQRNFSKSHTHLFYFVLDPKDFVFRNLDANNRVASKRQILYNDPRADVLGRLPDDTWIFSRVAGTHTQRNDAGHGCQMPEQILARIINTCSEPGALVFDPFGGSGTTPAVAKKLGRKYLATELSEDYCIGIDERLAACNVGSPIEGDEEFIAVKMEQVKGQPDRIIP